ncbi:nuclear body protein SP140-like protein [Pteronotus mesoamericanus]|uniref:nuclear body protein SP140-like protein n=1 Tax=Pteronotus mesoamericanus TaxID=1884717 RepID=UPI0023EE06D5|nr:nuclear body protein SP140-like protein [Pteronotus parnellii mesoamericanus]
MSAEDQNSDNSIEKTALRLFKMHKVAISHRIKDSFPLFELLRDNEFITNEKYAVSKENFNEAHNVEEVVYDVLTEAQKKFEPSLLKILFNEFTLKKYPGLNRTYEIFKNAIPDKNFFPEIDAQGYEERSHIQSIVEQETGENSDPSLLPGNSLHPLNYNVTSDNGLSEQLLETEETNAVETGTTTGNSDALESQPANEQRAQELDPAGAELPSHGIAWNFGPIHPANIKKEKTSFTAGVDWEAQGRTDCNQPSAIIVISDEDSTEHRNKEPPEASASAQKRKPDTVNQENNSTSEKTKRKRKSGKHKEDNVNMEAEILPVTCGELEGSLIKRKLERGVTRKCIRSKDGNWFTLREFEVRGGYEKSSNWKISLTCGGKTLKRLIEDGKLPIPPTTCGRNKKGGNPNKCKICQDGGKLFCCEKCWDFFHENCHLPPVDTKRSSWICTFCTIENSSRSQQRYKESEVQEREMGPEEKLKCEFLLLNIYDPLESDVFLKIPHENYVEKASQCLERLRMLDKIKKRLNEGGYTKVKGFVQDTDLFFQDPKFHNSELIKEGFDKNFKAVFAIQETN